AVVTVKAPAVEGRVAGGIVAGDGLGRAAIVRRAVAQRPPHEAVDLRLHHVRDAVGQVQAIDDAGALLAGVGVDGIVFGDDNLDAAAGAAPERRGDLSAEVRGDPRPAARV